MSVASLEKGWKQCGYGVVHRTFLIVLQRDDFFIAPNCLTGRTWIEKGKSSLPVWWGRRGGRFEVWGIWSKTHVRSWTETDWQLCGVQIFIKAHTQLRWLPNQGQRSRICRGSRGESEGFGKWLKSKTLLSNLNFLDMTPAMRGHNRTWCYILGSQAVWADVTVNWSSLCIFLASIQFSVPYYSHVP